MPSLGIIVNPDSGKDIRRLVSDAFVFSNEQKLNIIERLIVSTCAFGVDSIWIMPDRYGFGEKAINNLYRREEVKRACKIIDMPFEMDASDTQKATEFFVSKEVDCIVVLGGDGTTRLVSKYNRSEIPIMPISSGTNNVVPEIIEGTSAGVVVAFLSSLKKGQIHNYCRRHKYFEVEINDVETDIALVDVAFIEEDFIGSKAVWNPEKIMMLYVTRAYPGSLGLSSIIGVRKIVDPWSELAEKAEIGSKNGEKAFSMILPGLVSEFSIKKLTKVFPNQTEYISREKKYSISLDGERQIIVGVSDTVKITLRLDGPWFVNTQKVLEQCVKDRFFISKSIII